MMTLTEEVVDMIVEFVHTKLITSKSEKMFTNDLKNVFKKGV